MPSPGIRRRCLFVPTPPTNLAELLTRDEGIRRQPYYDSLGFVTVGVGHLIDPRKPCPLPDEIIARLLQLDIQEKTDDVETALPWVKTLDPVRRAVVISMAFQLGINGLLQFKNALKRLELCDYSGAATAFLDSKVARLQTPERWQRFASMILTGTYA